LPAWNGTSTTIARALRLIADGALDGGSVEQLAGRLGIGGRHLRRLFDEQLGASPVSIAASRRFLFAKKLLAETVLPISEVAFAAGFSSVRRFNDAMQSAYGRAPRELRGKATSVSGGSIELTLPFRPPYNWKALAAFLAPRAIPGVEEVTADRYRRNLPGGFVEVRLASREAHLLATFEMESVRDLAHAAARLHRLFDTGAPIRDIEQHLAQSPRLRETVARQSGMRVPGAWDPFELTVRAVLGQQVTVKGATTLAGRLVESFGAKTARGFLFPEPRTLAAADIARIGLPRARAEALRAVARAFDSASPPETAGELRELPGIGDWTAQYVAMRAFSEPDAFPATDLGLIKAAGRDVARQAEQWRPWRAYAAMHLWMEHSND
jgi:AraC family transcriptional regulator of adaptative response / DNA-3-methyladenine glycosylase II